MKKQHIKEVLGLYEKSFSLKAAQGAEVTPELLTKVNKFALRELTAEEIFVRKYLMAHNAVDRDNERFSEPLLDDFAKTFPGKSLLNGHDRYALAIGLFFDAVTEEITPQQFTAFTGEEARLPENISMVKVLWGWIYMLKAQFNEQMMANIDAGIYRHASIGFTANDIAPVKGQFDQILYWEYSPPGEALEGSIVWLGAQQGATSQKKHDARYMMHDADKSAVSFSPTIPADEGRAWDAGAAKTRLAKWASADGSGDKDKIDWPEYRKGFAWYDAENPENIGSYKLPHHDVIDGAIAVVWNGVSASMGALLGARGGVDIPESDKDSVYNHLSKHYKQFDKEPPEKSADKLDPPIKSEDDNEGGKNKMEKFLKILQRLFPGKNFTEDGLNDELKSALEAHAQTVATDEVAKATKPLNEKIAELTPLAADGKAYRDGLGTQYVTLKAKLGEVGETPEAQDKVKAVAATYPIDFLKTEVDALQKRVDEKFPDESQTKGDDRRDKSGDGGEKDWKKENPLVPKEGK